MPGFCAARIGSRSAGGVRLDEISTEAVIAALDELIAAYPASAEARQARLRAETSEVDHLAAG